MKNLTLALVMLSFPTLVLAANPGSPGPDPVQSAIGSPVATHLRTQNLSGPRKNPKKGQALEKAPEKKTLKKFRLSNMDLPKKRR